VPLTAPSATKSAAHAPAAEFSAPAASHVPVATVPEVPASMQSESFAEEIPSRPQELKIDSGAHPPAFGSLLETPVVKEEEDSSLTTQANPVPAMERDWRSAEVEEEVEEEEEPTSSWRRDAGDEAFADDGTTGPVHDWRDIAFAQASASQPAKEKTDYSQADETQDVAGIEPVPAASQAPAAPEPVSAQSDDQATVPVVSASETAAASEPEKTPAASSWFSVAPSPWEAEAQKASHLASSWDAVAVAPPKETEAEAPAVNEGASAYVSKPLLEEEAENPAATVEAIREEAAHVAERVTQEASAGDNIAKSPAPETDMEAMVAKVLSKLNPDVLQALTREILKPVIESIVKDELNAKKP
jgi:hypothetical protein